MSDKVPFVEVKRILPDFHVPVFAKLIVVPTSTDETMFVPEICADWKKFNLSLLTPWNFTFFQQVPPAIDTCDSFVPAPHLDQQPQCAPLYFLGGGIYLGRVAPIITLKTFSF